MVKKKLAEKEKNVSTDATKSSNLSNLCRSLSVMVLMMRFEGDTERRTSTWQPNFAIANLLLPTV